MAKKIKSVKELKEQINFLVNKKQNEFSTNDIIRELENVGNNIRLNPQRIAVFIRNTKKVEYNKSKSKSKWVKKYE